MSIRFVLFVLAATAVLAMGCGGSAQPVSPSLGPSMSIASSDGSSSTAGTLAAAIAGGVERAVMLFDACDPATFNAAIGPGTCTRSGGVTFQTFLEQLAKHQTIGAWRFSPGVLTMKAGQTLVAVNHGGEAHTFTEVEEFGGGIVPVLNTLTGLTTVAPECTQLQAGDFLPPGGRSSEVEDEEGVEKYQCCLHPWMRAEVRVGEK